MFHLDVLLEGSYCTLNTLWIEFIGPMNRSSGSVPLLLLLGLTPIWDFRSTSRITPDFAAHLTFCIFCKIKLVIRALRMNVVLLFRGLLICCIKHVKKFILLVRVVFSLRSNSLAIFFSFGGSSSLLTLHIKEPCPRLWAHYLLSFLRLILLFLHSKHIRRFTCWELLPINYTGIWSNGCRRRSWGEGLVP